MTTFADDETLFRQVSGTTSTKSCIQYSSTVLPLYTKHTKHFKNIISVFTEFTTQLIKKLYTVAWALKK